MIIAESVDESILVPSGLYFLMALGLTDISRHDRGVASIAHQQTKNIWGKIITPDL